MQFYKHPDCNTALRPSLGEEDAVAELPVQQGFVGPNRDIPITRSFWVPSDAELTLLRTGRYCIALSVLAKTHAPVRVDICEAKVDIAMLRESSNDKIYVPPGA